MNTFNEKKFSKMVSERVIGSQSLRDAAKQTGISASTLCRIKAGRLPSMDVLGILCEKMGVSVDTFFSRE